MSDNGTSPYHFPMECPPDMRVVGLHRSFNITPPPLIMGKLFTSSTSSSVALRHLTVLEARGYSHKAYGDVPPKWVTFSPKILRHDFCQKNPWKRIPFHKNCEKLVKLTIFVVGKPLEMGPNLKKIRKNRQISSFLRKIIRVPPPPGLQDLYSTMIRTNYQKLPCVVA